MNPEPAAKTFFFQSLTVGYFAGDRLPDRPGQYQYVPFRGPGHRKMQESLAKSGPQRCHYLVAGEKRSFTVVKLMSYGVLELDDFAAGSDSESPSKA